MSQEQGQELSELEGGDQVIQTQPTAATTNNEERIERYICTSVQLTSNYMCVGLLALDTKTRLPNYPVLSSRSQWRHTIYH